MGSGYDKLKKTMRRFPYVDVSLMNGTTENRCFEQFAQVRFSHVVSVT